MGAKSGVGLPGSSVSDGQASLHALGWVIFLQHWESRGPGPLFPTWLHQCGDKGHSPSFVVHGLCDKRGITPLSRRAGPQTADGRPYVAPPPRVSVPHLDQLWWGLAEPGQREMGGDIVVDTVLVGGGLHDTKPDSLLRQKPLDGLAIAALRPLPYQQGLAWGQAYLDRGCSGQHWMGPCLDSTARDWPGWSSPYAGERACNGGGEWACPWVSLWTSCQECDEELWVTPWGSKGCQQASGEGHTEGCVGTGIKSSQGEATKADRLGAPRPQLMEGLGPNCHCSCGLGPQQGDYATTVRPSMPATWGEDSHHDDTPLANAVDAC